MELGNLTEHVDDVLLHESLGREPLGESGES